MSFPTFTLPNLSSIPLQESEIVAVWGCHCLHCQCQSAGPRPVGGEQPSFRQALPSPSVSLLLPLLLPVVLLWCPSQMGTNQQVEKQSNSFQTAAQETSTGLCYCELHHYSFVSTSFHQLARGQIMRRQNGKKSISISIEFFSLLFALYSQKGLRDG